MKFLEKTTNFVKAIFTAIGAIVGIIFIIKKVEDNSDEVQSGASGENSAGRSSNAKIRKKIRKSDSDISSIEEDIEDLDEDLEEITEEDPKSTGLKEFFDDRGF